MQAVLFDLDGTLLRLDTEEFMSEYMKDLARVVSPILDPRRFIKVLLTSTDAMRDNRDPSLTNSQVFWKDFSLHLQDHMVKLEPVIDNFYATEFKKLSRVVVPCTIARTAVQAALDQGLRIVLATNPLFPMSAIRERMVWAGVEDLPWEVVTSYEDIHFCKPHPEYYQEISGLLGLSAQTCLMVGNDVEADLAAARVGMKTYLVTDYLYNPSGKSFYTDWKGSLEELARWFKEAGWKQCDPDH